MHTPAGHLLSTICSIYSSLKYFKVVITGLGAVLPKPQGNFFNVSLKLISKSISSSGLTRVILLRILSIVFLPLRVVHCRRILQIKIPYNTGSSTIQVVSSITITPPEPIMDPILLKLSKSRDMSRYSAGIHPPEGPPV